MCIRDSTCSLVQPDGSYAVSVAPGDYALEVHDLVTGIAVATRKEAVEVTPGLTRNVALRAEVATVRVLFAGPTAPMLPVESLRIVAGNRESKGWRFVGKRLGLAGLHLRGRAVDIPIYVPEGDVQIELHRGAQSIEMGAPSYVVIPLKKTRIAVTAGQLHVETFNIPEPPPILDR